MKIEPLSTPNPHHDLRPGDSPERKFFRAGRFSISNGKYYFCTREGSLEGPFDNLKEAEGELALFIRRKHEQDILEGGADGGTSVGHGSPSGTRS